ncbi:unnamed protein product [Gadus morhua 'NCC']
MCACGLECIGISSATYARNGGRTDETSHSLLKCPTRAAADAVQLKVPAEKTSEPWLNKVGFYTAAHHFPLI